MADHNIDVVWRRDLAGGGDYVSQQRVAADLVEHFGCTAGKSALLVTEQLGFQNPRRQGRAVHTHEGTTFARAVDVNRARHHLLAGAGFPAQQYRGRGLRHLFHLGQHLAQRRRIADDGAEVECTVGLPREHAHVLRKLIQQAAILAHQVKALHRVHQDPTQLLAVPGLGDIAVDAAQAYGLYEHIHVGKGRDDNSHGIGADVAHSAQ